MRHKPDWSLFVLLLLGSDALHAEPVLLISIDGMHPAYVLEAERRGLEIPNLRSFVSGGAYAQGVVGVVPTVTYPSHTTIVTGAAPAEHGIASNTTFDPNLTNLEGWYWYAEDIRVPTLWQAVGKEGHSTAAVNWPVTVGDRNIDYLLPEYWRTDTPDDLKLIRALARPEGALETLEGKLGPFVDGYDDTLDGDEIRTRFAVEVLGEHSPYFMAVHLVALDGTEHRDGPFVPSAYATLEAIDGMIGRLSAAALRNDPETVVAVVSDHGFIATHTAVNLRSRFVDTGLIRLEAPDAGGALRVASWDAQAWPGGAVAAIVLRVRDDAALRRRTARLLAELEAEAGGGIAHVLDGKELAARHGFPGADFLIEFAPGFYFGSALTGELLTPGTSRGTHGYLPERPEMHSAFFVKGAAIAAGRNLGIVDMRAIAPTLAQLLKVALPSASEPTLAVSQSGDDSVPTSYPVAR